MQNSSNSILRKVLASALVVILTAGNLLAIGNSMVSYAEGNLETQNEKTGNKNVEFGAYLISEGERVHSLNCDVKEGTNLYLHINVKEAGFLKAGKVEMVEANYEITGELEESDIIGEKSLNGLNLKQISYGTDATIELPIGYKRAGEEVKVEDISKESKIVLSGTYITGEGKEVGIRKEVAVNVAWETKQEIEVKSELITYKEVEEGIILQEKIEIEGKANNLPVKETQVEVEAPEVGGSKPEEVRVISNRTGMTNGKEHEEVEIKWNYNKETGKVEIKAENKETEGKVTVGEGKDEYIVTYEYKKAEEGQTIEREAKVRVVSYSGAEGIKEVKAEEKIEGERGSLVNGEIEVEGINKAKIYANYNSNKREYETEYKIKEIVNVAKAGAVEEIEITNEEEVFVTGEGEEKSTKIGAVGYAYYKSTKVSEKNLKEVLGKDGKIVVENEAGEKIGEIDGSKEAKDGEYEIDYAGNNGKIIIKTSKPKTEGNLKLEHTKAIKADLGYSKEEVESFKGIKARATVGERAIEGEAKLEEAERKIKVESNKEAINEREEEIELKVELGNNEENGTLYSNPEIRVKLPEFVEEVEVTNVNLLFEDELEIGETVTEEEGEGKAIKVRLEGTQTEFSKLANATTIILGAKVTVKEGQEVGDIVAEVEGSSATASILSSVKEEKAQASILGAEIPIEEIAVEDEESETNEEIADTETDAEIEEYGEIAIKMFSNQAERTLTEGENIKYILNVYSTVVSEDDSAPEILENVLVKDFLPNGVTFENATMKIRKGGTGDYEEKDIATYDAKNRAISWNIGNLATDEFIILELNVSVNSLEKKVYEKDISNSAIATYAGGDNISSNEITVKVAKPYLSITKLTDNVKSVNNLGDRVKLTLQAKNIGKLNSEETKVSMILPNEIIPVEVSYGVNDNANTMSCSSREIYAMIPSLNPEESYELCLTGIIDLDANYKDEYKTIEPKATIGEEEVTWVIKIENPDNNVEQPNNEEPNENPQEAGNQEQEYNPNNENGNNNSENNNSQQSGENANLHSISGVAWLDENKDGIRQATERVVDGLKVKLTQGNNTVKTVTTDKNGIYSFENTADGEYQVVFEYDPNMYKLTEYRKTGEKEINSSAISGVRGEALTDVINVTEDALHINIGLIKIPEFDMSLRKVVNRVIVQNGSNTQTYEYGTDYAKLDINAKYLKEATVLVEYKIIITNEGEIAGKVKSVVDYMPRDMTFSTDLNRTWIQDSNGNLYNSELKGVNIEPGETKELLLVLKKVMTEENVGLISNTAELDEVENTENIKDRDSNLANRVDGEDDMSSASVLLGVRTGSEVFYTTFIIVILIIISTGAYIINRKVLKVTK